MPSVNPIIDKLFSGRAFRLRDLVFVVGESIIFSAGVNIHRISQIGGAHRGAFYVPAGIAAAPGRIPLHNVRWIGFEP